MDLLGSYFPAYAMRGDWHRHRRNHPADPGSVATGLLTRAPNIGYALF
jgi:hypothetical protein